MFRPRRLQVRTQIDTINLLVYYLRELKYWVERGRVVLSMEEMDELEESLDGLRTLVEMVEWANYRRFDPPTPGR